MRLVASSARLLLARAGRRPPSCVAPTRGWHDVASPGRMGDPAPSEHLPAAVKAYLRQLHAKPSRAAAATAATAAAVGDGLAQLYWLSGMHSFVSKAMEYEPMPGRPESISAAKTKLTMAQPLPGAEAETGVLRTLRFAGLVGVVVGIAGELWFRRLLRPFPGWTYDVALRTTFDQALFAPATLACVVGGVTLHASGGNTHYAMHKLHHDCIGALGTMWTWWLGGVTCNYLLVPTPWQPVFVVGLATAWTAHVSARLHSPTDAGPDWRDTQRMLTDYLRNSRNVE